MRNAWFVLSLPLPGAETMLDTFVLNKALQNAASILGRKKKKSEADNTSEAEWLDRGKRGGEKWDARLRSHHIQPQHGIRLSPVEDGYTRFCVSIAFLLPPQPAGQRSPCHFCSAKKQKHYIFALAFLSSLINSSLSTIIRYSCPDNLRHQSSLCL
ncbi:hypothetical protein J3R30DRAFT_748977 [Lentinula aciculospora]|uniref:Uncharacterized protein n=1 Tax=Lentinula aciculospora TaxID=153920 RepID=A0A9W9A345_9AGAR|nr:hypothetical protein J3R30DRAFT_748977 [Lentinula aciculospora]